MNKKARAPAADELEPMTGGSFEALLVVGAVVTVALVALWFKLDVNRVFDVPKALALKVGGCGLFVAWLVYGLFNRGWPWKSIKVFGAPVAALTIAVMVSTLLSIDPWMSFYGVYERQFGLQGFLGCVGIFLVTATCLRSRRGGVAVMISLAIIGGVMGTYSLLQARGVDPLGFFQKPHNKVYATLGNPNFAGNALALIFPISMVLGVVAVAKTMSVKHLEPSKLSQFGAFLAVAAGFAATIVLQTVPGWQAAVSDSMGTESKKTVLLFFDFISVALILIAGAVGSWGPAFTRSTSPLTRRIMDGFGAGAILASAVGIAIGVFTTRTRGAWAGTGAAVFLGLVFAPLLFRESRESLQRAKAIFWGLDGAIVLIAVGAIVLAPSSLFSVTVKSMFYAFEAEHTVYGQGQGTRKYLWTESPRVLFNHRATLERQYRDHDEYAKKVTYDAIDGVDLSIKEPLTESQKSFDTGWRQIAVWPFGIGIETYRYAFMSHKSKKLEALDPMTNHDNPHNNYLYVLASFGIVGLAAYLWLLARLLRFSYERFDGVSYAQLATKLGRSPTDDPNLATELSPRITRAIGFGVLTSFFSYAVYSIGGFDSVCCSAFLYLLLGAAAVYFDPQVGEPSRNIWVGIKRQWAAYRGKDPATVPNATPIVPLVLTAAILIPLLSYSIWGAIRVDDAERAFVGDVHHGRDLLQKAEDIKKAIQINPIESFYKQNLCSTYAEIARQRRYQAQRLLQEGKQSDAQAYAQEAEKSSKKAENACFAALDHAWAPENIFISLFQLYYGWHKVDQAEYALERGLEHSPHLGAVRANLAILQLERGGYKEALHNADWVIEVDPASEVAWRTGCRSLYFLHEIDKAETYCKRALEISPTDGATKQYMQDVERAKSAITATSASNH